MSPSDQKGYSVSVISRVNGEKLKVSNLGSLEKVKEEASSKAGELKGDCNVFVYASNGNKTHEGSFHRGELSLEKVSE